MSEAAVEFEMNSEYFREVHEEWVQAVGRGWRIDRVMIPLFLAAGLSLGGAGLALGKPTLQVPGAMFCFASMFEFLKRRRKRAQWLAHSMDLPWSGETLRIEVENRNLVQKKVFAEVNRWRAQAPRSPAIRQRSERLQPSLHTRPAACALRWPMERPGRTRTLGMSCCRDVRGLR